MATFCISSVNLFNTRHPCSIARTIALAADYVGIMILRLRIWELQYKSTARAWDFEIDGFEEQEKRVSHNPVSDRDEADVRWYYEQFAEVEPAPSPRTAITAEKLRGY
jgi:hypothetical protein